ncbi:hypothetical protein WJX73_000585 [Symbiochloris irregularis]|uniref:Inositol-tetrakisphosphate 1-kinase n=1 Tax=Symbiochloris irregularis TaxID=706552 RepID=A0AAW1PY18_9CHLO
MPEEGVVLQENDQNRLHSVGVALYPGKAEKHLRSKLSEAALSRGILLKALDYTVPLSQQGQLDAILHKIRLPEWEKELSNYQNLHPGTIVVDAPKAIRNVGSRSSMLAALGGSGIVLQGPTGEQLHVCAPVQVAVVPGCRPEQVLQQLQQADLQAPYVAKPLWADGREGAHGLAVLLDERGVQQVAQGEGPVGLGDHLLLSPFVDHGGCLFKVYVLGPITVMVRRPSLALPVDPADVLEVHGSVTTVGRVSSYHSGSWRGDAPLGDPPHWAVQALAQELRKRLGLTLFNFDLIQPDSTQAGRYPAGADYLCIDINYFPGYEKLPDYENLMAEFLVSLFANNGPERQLFRAVSCSLHPAKAHRRRAKASNETPESPQQKQ